MLYLVSQDEDASLAMFPSRCYQSENCTVRAMHRVAMIHAAYPSLTMVDLSNNPHIDDLGDLVEHLHRPAAPAREIAAVQRAQRSFPPAPTEISLCLFCTTFTSTFLHTTCFTCSW